MRRVALGSLALLVVASPARADDSCVEVTNTVGERTCSRFGQFWSTERAAPLFTAFGAWSGLTQPGRGFRHTVTDRAGSNEVQIDSARFIRGPIQSYGLDFRVGGMFARHGYFGFDMGVAAGHASGAPVRESGFQLAPAAGLNFIHMRFGPVLGVRVPLGKVSLRVEALTGLQVFALMTDARAPDGRTSAGVALFGGVVEPRLAADFWLSPDTTLSTWAGYNVLRPGDTTFGLSLAAHFRAFDGAF